MVLEHVYDFQLAIDEMTRVLKKGGVLIVGTPFMLKIHMREDYWRFTSIALKRLFKKDYVISRLDTVAAHRKAPGCYCMKMEKK